MKCKFCGRFIKDKCPNCKPLEDTEVTLGKMRFSTKDTWFVMSLAVESYLQCIIDKMYLPEQRGQLDLKKEYARLLNKIEWLNGITLQVINKQYGLDTVNEVVNATHRILEEAKKEAIKLEKRK